MFSKCHMTWAFKKHEYIFCTTKSLWMWNTGIVAIRCRNNFLNLYGSTVCACVGTKGCDYFIVTNRIEAFGLTFWRGWKDFAWTPNYIKINNKSTRERKHSWALNHKFCTFDYEWDISIMIAYNSIHFDLNYFHYKEKLVIL